MALRVEPTLIDDLDPPFVGDVHPDTQTRYGVQNGEPNLDREELIPTDELERAPLGIDDPYVPQDHRSIGIRDGPSAGSLFDLRGEIGVDDVPGWALSCDLALLQPDSARTQPGDGVQVVAHEDDGASFFLGGLHPPQGTGLELCVTDGKDLVHDHDVRLQV